MIKLAKYLEENGTQEHLQEHFNSLSNVVLNLVLDKINNLSEVKEYTKKSTLNNIYQDWISEDNYNEVIERMDKDGYYKLVAIDKERANLLHQDGLINDFEWDMVSTNFVKVFELGEE